MRKLKDYMKLIFTAIMCFFVSLVPGKKAEKERKAEVFGNPAADTGTNGSNEALHVKNSVKKEAVISIKKNMSESLKETVRKYQFHRHKLPPEQKIDSLVYYNTG